LVMLHTILFFKAKIVGKDNRLLTIAAAIILLKF